MPSFRRSVWAALRGSGSPPDVLVEVQQARLWWREFGIRYQHDLDGWPVEAIDRWEAAVEIALKYEEAMAEVERRRMARAAQGQQGQEQH
jgi:hypothetical protein